MAKKRMKGIVFGDMSNINRKGIEFVDDLKDAYNPLIYNNILNGRYYINPYGDIFDNDTGKIITNQKGNYYMNDLEVSIIIFIV